MAMRKPTGSRPYHYGRLGSPPPDQRDLEYALRWFFGSREEMNVTSRSGWWRPFTREPGRLYRRGTRSGRSLPRTIHPPQIVRSSWQSRRSRLRIAQYRLLPWLALLITSKLLTSRWAE